MSDTAITQYEQRVALNTGFKRAVSNLAMQTMVKALGDEEGARVEWMPASEVFKRRAMSDSYNGRKPEFSPWTKWPMEMARKTALKWAFARGLISMEPAERAAVSMETEQEIVEIPPPQTVSEKAEALGLPEDIEPDWEELVPECETCGRNHTPGECDA